MQWHLEVWQLSCKRRSGFCMKYRLMDFQRWKKILSDLLDIQQNIIIGGNGLNLFDQMMRLVMEQQWNRRQLEESKFLSTSPWIDRHSQLQKLWDLELITFEIWHQKVQIWMSENWFEDRKHQEGICCGKYSNPQGNTAIVSKRLMFSFYRQQPKFQVSCRTIWYQSLKM